MYSSSKSLANSGRSCLVKKLKLRLFVFLSFFFFLLQSHTVLNISITGVETYSRSSAYTCWSPHRCPFDAFVSFAMFFFLCIFPCVCFLLISCAALCHIEAFHSCSCCLAQFRRWFFLHLYQRQCVVDVISYQVNSYHNVAYTVCATAILQLGFSQYVSEVQLKKSHI